MRLYINNFRALTDLEVDFADGINVITGESGSGKTSIINSFLWCLYGSKKVTNHVSTNGDKPTRVVLSDILSVNGKSSEILIFRGDKGLDEKLEIGDADLLTPGFRVYLNGIEKSRPEALIESIYGDFTTFTTTALLKQKQNSQLLNDNMGSTVTSYIFPEEEDPLVKIEKLKVVSKELDVKSKIQKSKLDDLKRDLKELRDQISSYDDEVKDSDNDDDDDNAKSRDYPEFTYKSIEDTHYKDLYVTLIAEFNQNNQIKSNILSLKQSLVEPNDSKLVIYANKLKKYPKSNNLDELVTAKKLWDEYLSLKKDYSIVDIMDLAEAKNIIERLKKNKKLESDIKNALSIDWIDMDKAMTLVPEYEERVRAAEENNNRTVSDMAKYKEALSLWEKETSILISKKQEQDTSKCEYDRKMLRYQNAVERHNKYKQELEEYKRHSKEVLELERTLEELTSKSNSLEEMIKAIELNCPYCEERVVLMPNKKLIKSDENSTDTYFPANELAETKRKIDQCRLAINKKTKPKPVAVKHPGEEPKEPKYDTIEIPDAPKEPSKRQLIKITPITNKISYLNTYIDSYYSCSPEKEEQANKRISIDKDYNKYIMFVEKYGTPEDYSEINIGEVIKLVNGHNMEKQKYESQVKKRRETLAQINVLELSLKQDRYPEIIGDSNYAPYKLLLDLHNKNIKLLKLEDLNSRKDKLKKKIKAIKSEYDEIIEESTLCEKSINRLKSARAGFIIFTLKSISSNINRLLKELFSEDVQFSISQKKDKLSYEITYGSRGQVKLSAISGGEQDRISIAVTVAFALVCKSPVLFFDETLSSLDHDTRNVAYDLLKQELPDKKLIFIMHELNNAAYDNIFNLSKMNQ